MAKRVALSLVKTQIQKFAPIHLDSGLICVDGGEFLISLQILSYSGLSHLLSLQRSSSSAGAEILRPERSRAEAIFP